MENTKKNLNEKLLELNALRKQACIKRLQEFENGILNMAIMNPDLSEHVLPIANLIDETYEKIL